SGPIRLAGRDLAAPATAPLEVSSPHDAAEVEATTTAAKVMRMAAHETAAVRDAGGAEIRRKTAGPIGPTSDIGAELHEHLSGGTPLPGAVRSFMEPRFGADFSQVRIHTDEHASQLSERLDAQAFTVGSHIFFGKDQFRPDQPDGRELIAH